MAHDPFRARSKPEVNTEGLSPQAAESAEKAMPDNTGGTPDSTPGNHVPDQAPEQTGQTGQGEQEKPAEKAMPDNTGGTPDSTPGNHVPDQAPEQTGQTGQGEQEKPAEKPTHTAEQPRRRKGKRS